MTRALARELGESTSVSTPSCRATSARRARMPCGTRPTARPSIVGQQCLKQRVMPEDVAALVLFLASDDARLCTGHKYFVDAGWR